MRDNKIIPIFFATDDNYVPYLAVSVESMLDNASKDYFYKIYILNNGISDRNITRLGKYNTEYSSVEFVDVASRLEEVGCRLHTRDYYSKTTYYRLFIPNMFPEYKKALYLDCDITVIGDISEFYNIDIKDNLVGAITDEVVSRLVPFVEWGINNFGLKLGKYFNAGILIMNLEEFRKMDFENAFLDLLGKYTFRVAQDQDYLNVICRDRVHYIDKQWDRMPIEDPDFDETTLKLIHYNMNEKPWKFDNILYENYFWKYAEKTDYYQDIIDFKNSYTDEQRAKDLEAGANLAKLALEEAYRDDNFYNTYMKRAGNCNF